MLEPKILIAWPIYSALTFLHIYATAPRLFVASWQRFEDMSDAQAIYSEWDPYAADWIKNLVAAGHVAPGRVERRSIVDLTPADVAGPGQRHFFAGIGVWSHALRLAGWPDDLDVWTGSCPCQPFSTAGRGRGTDDERHLWPEWFRLIRECRPAIILGEQVASAAGLAWLDLVQDDLEGAGYAVGAADLCAAGVGAPHIRQRTYFVAVSSEQRREGLGLHLQERGPESCMPEAGGSGETGPLADATGEHKARVGQPGTPRAIGAHSATRGFWSLADWIPCTDGRSRPVEPGTFPLAHGAPTRVGADGSLETQPRAARLKGYGNAIVGPLAAEFVSAVMDALA